MPDLDVGQTVSLYWPAKHANSPAKLLVLGKSGRALVQLPNGTQTWVLLDQLKKKGANV